MAARGYKLITGNFGNIYISRVSKRDPKQMTADRVKVDNSDFIAAMLEWALSRLEDDEDTIPITSSGETVAEITIFRKALLKK